MNALAQLYDGFETLYPDDAARWLAVQSRDARADGILYYAVETTGIYCRPTCPARRPRRHGVSFYASCEAAEGAGFRPCKLCRPRVAARPQLGDGWSVRPAAVLFCDMIGFSALAAALPPEQSLRLSSEFHVRLGAAVVGHGGRVHKHLGDGLMALFGHGISRPSDAARAIAAGFAMIDALARWNAERDAAGLFSVAAGLGIHYGMVAVEHASGEVIGDTVNVASRLEGLTRRLGAALVVSDETVRAVPRPCEFTGRLVPIGSMRLAGCRPRLAWAALG
jgi:class 3 adenylate cyclase